MDVVSAVRLASALALVCCPATAAHADGVADWRSYIDEASLRFGVPAAWIERVMRAESGGRTIMAGRPITSPKGAMGLMQLMPSTWAAMRDAHRLGRDPHDPRDNILAGTAYLRAMYDRFGYPGLFAAYNAGPGRYAQSIAGDRMLPPETRAYLIAVAGHTQNDATPPVATARATVFVRLTRLPIAFTPGVDFAPQSGLFAIAPKR